MIFQFFRILILWLAVIFTASCKGGGGGGDEGITVPVEPGISATCIDFDSDGFTNLAPEGVTEGLVICASQNDCDDGNNQVFPGAVEITDDGIDQDCSGADSPGEGSTTGGSTTGGSTSGGSTTTSGGTTGGSTGGGSTTGGTTTSGGSTTGGTTTTSGGTSGDAAILDPDNDGLHYDIDFEPGEVTEWGYINKDLSTQCINYNNPPGYRYGFIHGIKSEDGSVQVPSTEEAGVSWIVDASKASLPTRGTCYVTDKMNSVGFDYGIYMQRPDPSYVAPEPEPNQVNWKSFDVLRGIKFDFNASGDEAREFKRLGALIGAENSSLLPTSQIKQDAKMYALLRKEADGYVANSKVSTWYTAVAYDANTMWVKSGEFVVRDDGGDTWTGSHTVPLTDILQGAAEGVDPQSLVYVAVLRGFWANLAEGIGAENTWVQVLVVDADGNSSAKPVDAENVKVHCTMRLRGPVSNPNYAGKVYYHLIAYDPQTWGKSNFSWYSSNQNGVTITSKNSGTSKYYQMSPQVQVDPSVTDMNQIFVGLKRWGFDHDYSSTREVDNFSGWVSATNVLNDGMFSLSMGGIVYGHTGTESTHPIFDDKPNEIKGYLFYCKSPASCQTKWSSQAGKKEDFSETGTSDFDYSIDFSDTLDLPATSVEE